MSGRWILDFRAGAPWTDASLAVHRRALAAAWADPAHPSSEGRRAATWLEAARATVSELSGYPHVRFMANREEAMNRLLSRPGDYWTAVTNRQRVLEQVQHQVAVDDDGMPQFPALPTASLAILQAANDETGVIDSTPAGHHILDASASFGRAPIAGEPEVVLTSSRAWGSPSEVAILLSRQPLGLTDSAAVPEVAVAVEQLSRVLPAMPARHAAEQAAMADFERSLSASLPDVQFHGRQRVPHIRSLSILHLDAETLMRALDERGYVVGSGSACVLDGRPSHVLASMGRVTHGNLRLALPWDLELAQLEQFAVVLAETAQRLRHEAGVADL